MIPIAQVENDQVVLVERGFAAAPPLVFRAWTQPEEVTRWFGTQANRLIGAEIDLQVGGRWKFLITDTAQRQAFFTGEYLTIIADNHLEFTWSHVTILDGHDKTVTPQSIVNVHFDPEGRGTRIRLIHSGISSQTAQQKVGGGWNDSFDALQMYLQSD